MKQRNNNRNNTKRGTANNNARTLGGEHYGIIRARVTGSGSVTVSTANLAGAFGAIATSTTSLRSTARSVRIIRVKLLVPPPSSGTVNSGRLTWLGSGNFEARSSIINSTNNPARTALISAKPPPMSAAALWSDNDGDLFSIHAPVGTIVTVEAQLIQARPGIAGLVPTVTVAGLTTGDVYYAALATTLLTIDDGN
jgi:hypothetical protein